MTMFPHLFLCLCLEATFWTHERASLVIFVSPGSCFLEHSMLVSHVLVECGVPSGDENTKRATQHQLLVSGVLVSFHVWKIVGAVLTTFTLENSPVRMISSIVDGELPVILEQLITVFTLDIFTLRLCSNIELCIYLNPMNTF